MPLVRNACLAHEFERHERAEPGALDAGHVRVLPGGRLDVETDPVEQRQQLERPIVHTGMRQDQLWRVQLHAFVEQEIEIDGAVRPATRDLAPQPLLDEPTAL